MASNSDGTITKTITSSIYLSFAFLVPSYLLTGIIFAVKLPKDNKRFSVYINILMAYLLASIIMGSLVSSIFGLVLYFLYSGFYIYDLAELRPTIILAWLLFLYSIGAVIGFMKFA